MCLAMVLLQWLISPIESREKSALFVDARGDRRLIWRYILGGTGEMMPFTAINRGIHG